MGQVGPPGHRRGDACRGDVPDGAQARAMSDPLRPRPARLPGDRLGPGPGRLPRPIPWTPFGPGDNTPTPEPGDVEARRAKTRAVLEKAQLELTRMRHGPGPDNTPPRVVETTRADGLWPFLLLRYAPGDAG